MRKTGSIILMFALAVIFVVQPRGFCEEKKRIAVFDFENKAGWGGHRVGYDVSEMLVTKLVKAQKYTVLERSKLEEIMKEQDLGASGRVTATSAASIGKLLGVKYAVIGAITEFGKSESGANARHLFGVKKDKYSGTVDVRVVDTENGEILVAETASSSSSNVRVKVLGVGGGKGYDEKIAHEVLRDAINQVAEKIIAVL